MGLLKGRKEMGSWVHDMSLHKNEPQRHPVFKWISGFVKSILFSDCVFLSIHRLVLIRNSLCAYSQRPCSIRLKLFCVCGMIFAFKWAAVPHRSTSLCWRHQSYTSFSSFAPPHILHIRRRDRDWRGGGWGEGFIRISWVRNESWRRQVAWTQLLLSQVAGNFDMWYTNRILQLDSLSTCGSHPWAGDMLKY